MITRPRSESDYPFEEFLKHFADADTVRNYEFVEFKGEMIEVGEDHSIEVNHLRQRDYFTEHYPPDLAKKYMIWFDQFSFYLAQNIESFNTGRLAVHSSDPDGASMISKKLLRALHDVLIHATDEEWASETGPPPPSRVVELCQTKYLDYDEDSGPARRGN